MNEHTERFAAYIDTLGATIPDRSHLPAPKAAARVRRLFRELAPWYTDKLAWHAMNEIRVSRPATLRDRDHQPSEPVGMRLPVGRLDRTGLATLVEYLSELCATIHRLDVALDLDLAAGVQLALDQAGFAPSSRGWRTRYLGDLDLDVSTCAYCGSSKPAGFGDDRPVQRVEHRLYGAALPTTDPLAVLSLDPFKLWHSLGSKRPIEPVSKRHRELLETLRSKTYRGGFVSVSDSALAEELDCVRSTIQRAISELRDFGFVRVVHRERGRGNRSLYRVVDPNSLWFAA